MILGIDIGGTKIDYSIIENSGLVLDDFTEELPKDYKSFLSDLISKIQRLSTTYEVDSVGIGVPGILDNNGIIREINNIEFLIGRSFAKELSIELSKPISICNHLTCFALSESFKGYDLSNGISICIIIGTGVGAAILISGEHYLGANKIAGEIGNSFQIGVRDSQITESMISGKKLQSIILRNRLKSFNLNDVFLIDNHEIKEYFQNLSRFLSNVIFFYDPSSIVIGGGIGNIKGLDDFLKKQVHKLMIKIPQNTRIRCSYFGSRSGARGAALLRTDLNQSSFLHKSGMAVCLNSNNKF